jgi:hypothetical protein
LASYVIYSHGLIVEGDDPKPISPKYGQYDFPAIKQAICDGGDVVQAPGLTLGGNLLSIYETSDELGPCTKLAARSHLTSFKEVAISTGKKHGAFFQPLPEWVRPLPAWIAETNRDQVALR